MSNHRVQTPPSLCFSPTACHEAQVLKTTTAKTNSSSGGHWRRFSPLAKTGLRVFVASYLSVEEDGEAAQRVDLKANDPHLFTSFSHLLTQKKSDDSKLRTVFYDGSICYLWALWWVLATRARTDANISFFFKVDPVSTLINRQRPEGESLNE